MRILAVQPNSELYGSDRQLLTGLVYLASRGHDVSVLCYESSAGEPNEFATEAALRGLHVATGQFPVLRKAHLRSLRGWVGLIASIFTLVPTIRRLRRGAPDVLLINTIIVPIWIVCGKLIGANVVCHVHEAEDQMNRHARRILTAPLLMCDRVIANSVASADLLSTDHPRLVPKLAVIPNGVERPSTPPLRLPSSRPSTLGVTYIGRLAPRKGVDLLVEALVELAQVDHMPIRASIIGSEFNGPGHYSTRLKDRVTRSGLDGQIHFLGFVQDVWPHLDTCQVVVIPSRVEPFGNVAVEAMARGRILIASRVGGLQHIPIDGVSGILVPPNSPEAIASALRSIWSHWEVARHLGAEAVQRAKDFDPGVYCARLEDVLLGARR